MIKTLTKNTHKALSVISLLLNGGIFANYLSQKYFEQSSDFIENQIKGLKVPEKGLINKFITKAKELNWSTLELKSDIELQSVEGFCKSGLGGLLESKFSKDLLGQTTHFGLIYPVLALVYGDDWHTDGKVALGIGVVGLFEVTHWWVNESEASELN
jgi:hypothetical protein